MPRVLHLAEQSADHQTNAMLAAVGAGEAQTVRRIGRGGDYSDPVSAALHLFREPRGEGRGGFDLVHAWGATALKIAAIARREPVVFTPTDFPSRPDIRWLRATLLYRRVEIICTTDTIRRRLVEGGVPIASCHLIRPGVDFSSSRKTRDDRLRFALGLNPGDRVTLVPGEATKNSSHELAVFAMTLLNVLDRKNRLLVWGRGDHAGKVRRFAQRLEQPTLVDAEQTLRRSIEFEALLAVADDVLITASAAVPTLAISQCMAAGLPIVSTVTPTLAELLEDRHTAMFVTKPSPRLLAQRMLDLRRDGKVSWQISDMARTEAFAYFSRSRMLELHRTLYQQLSAGEKVELPPPSSSAGLRFHGRG